MLRRTFLAVVTCSFVTSIAFAGPKEDVQAAIQKLANSPNYHWTATVVNRDRGALSPTEGKTQLDGYTYLSLTMPGGAREVFINAKDAIVKTADGWKLASELIADTSHGLTPDLAAALIALNSKTPAALAQKIVNELPNVQQSNDSYTADLTESQAKELLDSRPAPPNDKSGNFPQVKVGDGCKGTVKYWVTDGTLVKMEIHLIGSIRFSDEDSDRDIDRTTTIVIDGVGSTTFDIPAEVQSKLPS